MAYLFIKDVVQQSLRLGFINVQTSIYSKLFDLLIIIKRHCLLLLQSFIPPFKRTLENKLNKGVNIIEDKYYILIYINLKGYIALSINIEIVLKIKQNISVLLTLSTLIPLSQELQDIFNKGIYSLLFLFIYLKYFIIYRIFKTQFKFNQNNYLRCVFYLYYTLFYIYIRIQLFNYITSILITLYYFYI